MMLGENLSQRKCGFSVREMQIFIEEVMQELQCIAIFTDLFAGGILSDFSTQNAGNPT